MLLMLQTPIVLFVDTRHEDQGSESSSSSDSPYPAIKSIKKYHNYDRDKIKFVSIKDDVVFFFGKHWCSSPTTAAHKLVDVTSGKLICSSLLWPSRRLAWGLPSRENLDLLCRPSSTGSDDETVFVLTSIR